MTFGPKNQSFRNKSGKTQPIRTKFGTRGHIKGWQRSGNLGHDRPILDKMGAGTTPVEREFFLCGKPDDLSATSQRPISTKFGHETYLGVQSRNPERHFRKLGVICPQNLKSKIGQTGILLRAIYSNNAQSRLQVTGCTAERHCLLHVVVQGPVPRSSQFFSTT